jgi:hypothetical protein
LSRLSLALAALLVSSAALAAPARLKLADLTIPGDPKFVALARDVADLVFAFDPSVAANAGLYEDAVRVPSFEPAALAAAGRRLDDDLAKLRALPWRTYPIDEQIDFRWIYANAETVRLQIDEQAFLHRPAAWLEPLANDLIALVTYRPEERARIKRVLALVPPMVAEMRSVAAQPTKRDVTTALELCKAIGDLARASKSPEGQRAAAALADYAVALAGLTPERDFAVIGPEHYAWRVKHVLMLPWDPAQLLALARATLADVDRQRAELAPRLPADAPATPEERKRAHALTRDGLLHLYDAISERNVRETARGGFVTLREVGPIRARETPDGMVPLTGDGGSMNSPPPFNAKNVGYWNVEHFHADWPEEKRLERVLYADHCVEGSCGSYSAHEGVPGHHLQLSIARLNPDPLRSILPDPVLVEGWALYAEELFWSHGGLGPTDKAREFMLRGFRARILRVIYDVQIETGVWDLQQGADFRDGAAPGKGNVNEEVRRAIQWPGQLVCYFAGKMQIVALREAVKKKLGDRFDERAFHDALLAEGAVPVALIRAKMLGEPIPDL